MYMEVHSARSSKLGQFYRTYADATERSEDTENLSSLCTLRVLRGGD
jgi:hypothetical protein